MATAQSFDAAHHGHGHSHDHAHPHPGAAAEPTLAPSRDGSVLMEVGGDIGALVLYTERALDGSEIDLFAAGSDRPFVHSAVRARHLVDGTLHAAVYPGVPAGDYVIAAHGSVGPIPVTIAGGRVTEVPLGG
jgi:hypothetical protein